MSLCVYLDGGESMSNEQWVRGGDCTKCRRQKYCSKDCKQHEIYNRQILSATVAEAMMRIMQHGTKSDR